MDFNAMNGSCLDELFAAESGIDFLTDDQITAILDCNHED